jgi:cytochrome c oxidase subunit 2
MSIGGLTTLYSRICSLGVCFSSPTSIFSTTSTPADKVRLLSLDVMLTLGCVFLAVLSLLAYALVRYRAREGDTVVFEVQDAPAPSSALDVTVIGHQYWWEFRYPKYNVVTANELHIPLSDPKNHTPTYMKLTSADVIHSFWVPSLAGKTDLLPNRVNEMWVDPHVVGMYEGQCAQFCGAQHAKMLLRVYVDTPADFQRWITAQQQLSGPAPANHPDSEQAISSIDPAATTITDVALPGVADSSRQITPEQGRHVFEHQACISCHVVRGTVANGTFGPDLTHLMSRSTIAAGAAVNTPENILRWITDPNEMKPGSAMPAMHLTSLQNTQITAYLTTLH